MPGLRLVLVVNIANQLNAKLIGFDAEIYRTSSIVGEYCRAEIFIMLATDVDDNLAREETIIQAIIRVVATSRSN